ncbi:MAG: BatA domain-containing protein [Lentisphaeria bacterium]|nr:BatA domain-containing protein [Lentisphaeria bacterium]
MIGWVHMIMLAGMAALSIPVIIHLLRNRRFEPAEIGSLRFLRRAVRENVRWRRIRDLLLLLLRLLAIALLTALFARPFLIRPGSEEDRDADVVLLLDASGSMGGRLLGRPLWDVVRDTGSTVLAGLPDSARAVTACFATDVVVCEGRLPERPAAGSGSDYARALTWAADRLRHSKATWKDVVLVSDLQRTGLPEQLLEDWPGDIPVSLRSLPEPGPFNLAVASLRCLTPYPQGLARFAVHLVCSGDAPADPVGILLRVGDTEERRSLPPESQDVVFEMPDPPAGLVRGTVRVEAADAWPDDNALDFAFELRRSLRVAVVEGTPGETLAAGPGYFLSTALAGERDGTGRAVYAVRTLTSIEAPEEFDAVVLCDVPALGEERARRLAEAVRRGAGMLCFLGDNTDERAWQDLQRAELLPAAVRRTRVPVPEPILDWDPTHPIMRPFGNVEAGTLARIVFRDAFELEPHPDAAVAARLSGGHPAILSAKLGRGTIVVVTNPCNRAWTDWPTERLYLPLVREIAAFVTRLRDREGALVHTQASLRDPLPPGVHERDGTLTMVHPAADESRIERCSEAEFRAMLGIGPAPDRAIANSDADLPSGRERRNELWRWLAVALAAVLFVESVTADWPRRRPAETG